MNFYYLQFLSFFPLLFTIFFQIFQFTFRNHPFSCRVLNHWKLVIERKKLLHMSYTTMQSSSKQSCLKQAFSIWKTKYHHVEDINQTVVSALTRRESVILQQAFAIWKARYRHVEDIKQSLNIALAQKESRQLKQSFGKWKCRLVDKRNWSLACQLNNRFV